MRGSDRDGLKVFVTERDIGCEIYYVLPLQLQDVRIDILDERFVAVCHKYDQSATAIAVWRGYFENCRGVIRTLFLD